MMNALKRYSKKKRKILIKSYFNYVPTSMYFSEQINCQSMIMKNKAKLKINNYTIYHRMMHTSTFEKICFFLSHQNVENSDVVKDGLTT